MDIQLSSFKIVKYHITFSHYKIMHRARSVYCREVKDHEYRSEKEKALTPRSPFGLSIKLKTQPSLSGLTIMRYRLFPPYGCGSAER